MGDSLTQRWFDKYAAKTEQTHTHNPYTKVVQTPDPTPEGNTSPQFPNAATATPFVTHKHCEESATLAAAPIQFHRSPPAYSHGSVGGYTNKHPVVVRHPIHMNLEKRVSYVAYPPEEALAAECRERWVKASSIVDATPYSARAFIGNMWTNLWVKNPDYVMQLLEFVAATIFPEAPPILMSNAEAHYHENGAFRGCLHVMVTCVSQEWVEHVLWAMNRRCLFDLEGLWWAEDDGQAAELEDYCARVRRMPQHERHLYLQSLPCTPMVTELGRSKDAPTKVFPRAMPPQYSQ